MGELLAEGIETMQRGRLRLKEVIEQRCQDIRVDELGAGAIAQR